MQSAGARRRQRAWLSARRWPPLAPERPTHCTWLHRYSLTGVGSQRGESAWIGLTSWPCLVRAPTGVDGLEKAVRGVLGPATQVVEAKNVREALGPAARAVEAKIVRAALGPASKAQATIVRSAPPDRRRRACLGSRERPSGRGWRHSDCDVSNETEHGMAHSSLSLAKAASRSAAAASSLTATSA